MEVDEEIDDSRKEIDGRVLKKRLRAAFLVAPLVKRFKQRCSCLSRCCQVRDILPLYRVDTVGILHIGKVHDVETTVFRQPAKSFVFAVLIEQRLSQCRELIVIHHHGKSLGRMLTDKWVDDAKRLTRTGRTQYNGSTERIDDVNPSLVHASLEIVDHRDIDRIRILIQVLRLLERLILKVETVFTQFVIVVARDTI